MIKTKSKKEALEDRLGAVLGRSWVVVGAILESCLAIWQGKTLRFVNKKNNVFEKVRCQEATWVDLGPILGAEGLQNGHLGGSKKESS